MDVLNGLSKSIKTKFDCSTIGYLRTDNFPLREIGTGKKVRHNGGYVVTQLDCTMIFDFCFEFSPICDFRSNSVDEFVCQAGHTGHVHRIRDGDGVRVGDRTGDGHVPLFGSAEQTVQFRHEYGSPGHWSDDW